MKKLIALTSVVVLSFASASVLADGCTHHDMKTMHHHCTTMKKGSAERKQCMAAYKAHKKACRPHKKMTSQHHTDTVTQPAAAAAQNPQNLTTGTATTPAQ